MPCEKNFKLQKTKQNETCYPTYFLKVKDLSDTLCIHNRWVLHKKK